MRLATSENRVGKVWFLSLSYNIGNFARKKKNVAWMTEVH